MNIPPSEAKALSIYEYEALLWQWNDARAGDEADAPPIVDHAITQRLMDNLASRPDLLVSVKGEKPKPMPARL